MTGTPQTELTNPIGEESDDEEQSAEEDVEETLRKASPGQVRLPDGEAMDALSAASITGQRQVFLIVLAGAQGSGKTTLAASIYQQFQHGPFAGYLFAGSKTLVGWERRSHLARLESGGRVPDTERTLQGEPMRFLHLTLTVENPSTTRAELLLADVTGETYRRATDHEDEARLLTVLLRADWVAVLVDGDKLCTPYRQEALEQASMLLRSCLEVGTLRASSRVQVIFTKWDLVQSHQEHALAEALVQRAETDLSARFADQVSKLMFTRTAARGQPTIGLDSLLRAWVDTELPTRAAPTLAEPPHDARQFIRYGWKAAFPRRVRGQQA